MVQRSDTPTWPRIGVTNVRFGITAAGRTALAEPITCPLGEVCAREPTTDICLSCAARDEGPAAANGPMGAMVAVSHLASSGMPAGDIASRLGLSLSIIEEFQGVEEARLRTLLAHQVDHRERRAAT